jgi:RHS repeat-associated protein
LRYAQIAYDDFGNLATNSTETISNPFRYVGRYGVMTDLNDLLYMRARYYLPSLGRFVNKDPIGFAGGLNLYGYGGNNPISWVDPSGLKRWAPWWIEIWILPYGNYGGSLNTDPTFQTPAEDSLDELFMEHDKGWAKGECSLADKKIYYSLKGLPLNPNKWARKPRNTLWAILYRMGATDYFFWFSQ